MSAWHHADGSTTRYENPMRGEFPRQLWLNPNGAAFWAERAYPYIITGSILSIAGDIRGEAQLLLAGWRRVTDPMWVGRTSSSSTKDANA